MDNKVVLVTGSSKSIGKACVIEFASKGYDVVINYNSSEREALELKEYIASTYKVNVLALKCDVSNEEEVKKMVDNIIYNLKKIDVLVNNAGIWYNEPFENKTKEHFERTLNVNLIGTFLVSKYVSKNMLDNKFGKIVNISSTSGVTEFSPFSMDYNASKAGIISLTHDLAIQLQPYINVNAIVPGWIDTQMNESLSEDYLKEEIENTLVKRLGKPEDVAKLAVYLASDDANYINSQAIVIDGGRA